MSGELKHSKRKHPIRVFLSHSDVDMVFARHVRNLLSHRTNAQVFTTEELSAGENWEAKLRNELDAADLVVALLTPHAVDSAWVLHELGAAWALKKPIIPVVTRRDVLNNLPVPLASSQVIELSNVDTPQNADKFVHAFEDSVTAAHLA